MKKLVPLLILLFITSVLSAQETKHLTLEDYVLGASKGLYPSKPMQWVSNSDTYAYAENNTLFTESASISSKERKTEILKLEALQQLIPDLNSLPFPFLKITSAEVTFNHNNTVITYNYKNKSISKTISLPNEFENIDFNNKTHTAAYTIKNNLYIFIYKKYHT